MTNLWFRSCVGGRVAAAGKRDQSQSMDVLLATDSELKIAILVMSVIARLNPADVRRDTCVRLVTLLMQLLDVPSGQVRVELVSVRALWVRRVVTLLSALQRVWSRGLVSAVAVRSHLVQVLAAGLLGRGFALWTPHMSPANLTILIRRLLEIVVTGENSTTRAEANLALLKVRDR